MTGLPDFTSYTMKISAHLANIPKFQSNPGPAEIKTLLDLLPNAALFINRQNDRIYWANKLACELSGYNHEGLSNLKLSELVTNSVIETDEVWRDVEQENPCSLLHKANGENIDIHLSQANLSSKAGWAVINLEPADLQNHQATGQQRRLELMESMQMIGRAFHQDDIKAALDLFLHAAQKMTLATTLSIYLHSLALKGDDVEVIRKINYGTDVLPDNLPSQDIHLLRNPQFWQSGKRTTCNLHRSARSAGMSYVASAPLGQPQAQIGILVLAGDSSNPNDRIPHQVNILAEAITTLIEKNLQRSNLVKDLSEQTQINAIFRSVENDIQDGVIILDPELKIRRINSAAERILGYSNPEAIGFRVEDVLIGTETLRLALNAALKGVPTLDQENIRLYRRSGQTFLAQVSNIPILSEGQLIGISILIRDLSEQEQVQAQTQQLERRALLGEVTSVFAHEVRNPINNISTGLQLMAYNMDESDPNQEIIARLQHDCDRLSNLMKSVLAFSRPTEYEMENVDLEQLITRLLERSKPHMARVNVEYHLQSRPALATIKGNPRALEQVFTNLINNAIQAMSETGGMLAIKLQNATGHGKRKYIKIDVADNGPGIPKENLEQIFQPFFTTKSDGTGLGLAITKRIVTAHQGTIQVTSFPGGTVFQLQLPVLEET